MDVSGRADNCYDNMVMNCSHTFVWGCGERDQGNGDERGERGWG